MSPERWKRVQEVFDEALARAPDTRTAFLDEACAGDPDLHAEVRSLLEAFEEEGPVDEFAGSLVAPLRAKLWADPIEGTHIGPYRILREIGYGGMAVVYLAERDDAEFRQQVALKLVRRELRSESLVGRFLNERKILASLNHPHIAHFYDGGYTDDGHPYFVMEYVEGLPIDQYCDEHRLDTDRRLELFTEVCGAVQYAHRNLVVHRDLKPSNILVTEDGTVKLLDFGIAKLLQDDDGEALTQTATRVMTPEYASPEQVRGEPVTTASDLYSLGVVLYELLAGHRPYRVRTLSPSEVERVICEIDPPRPSTTINRTEDVSGGEDDAEPITPETVSQARSTRPERLQRRLSGDLDTIVLKALHKEPDRRYVSAEQLLDDIRRHLAGLPVSARPDTLTYRLSKFIRRHQVGVAAAVLVAVSLLAGIAGVAWQARVAAQERDTARLEAAKAQEISSFLESLFNASDPFLATESERLDTLQVRDFLDHGADKIQRELTDRPLLQAKMLNVIGDVYRNLGLLDEAHPLLERALALRRASQAADASDVAESLHSLAQVHHDQGSYDVADSLYREALRLRRQTFGAHHLLVAESLMGLGVTLRVQTEFEEAEQTQREALSIRRDLLGGEHPDVATTLFELAQLFHEKADLDQAETYYREALALRQRLLDEGHPHLAESLMGLANVLKTKGDLDAAEPLLNEALAQQRLRLGEDHPLTVSTLYELAMLQRNQGRLAVAESLFQQVIGLDRQHLGDHHFYVGLDLTELGITRNMRQAYAEAEQTFREALAVFERALPAEHPRTAVAMTGLGDTYMRMGHPERAEPLLRQALQIRLKKLGEDTWRTGVSKSALGECLMMQGRLDDAEPLLVEGYVTLRDNDGPTEAALQRLVTFYEQRGQHEKATQYRRLLDEAVH